MFHRKCEHELWTSWYGLFFALLYSALICDLMLILLLVFFSFFFLFFHFSIVSVDGDLGFKAPHQINKKSSSARFRLDGLDLSFCLMCSSLLSVISGGFEVIYWCIFVCIQGQNFDSPQGPICGPKMTFFLELVWVWFEKDSLRARVWVACLPLDFNWVLGLTSRVL